MRQPYLVQTESDVKSVQGVSNVALADIENLDHDDVAFWLIDMALWQDGWKTICQIRRHLSPRVYLKPVVFLIHDSDMPKEIHQAADGHITASSIDVRVLEDWVSRVEHINQWVEHIANNDAPVDTNLAFKVLRLISSRAVELQPITTIRRSSGYVYPLLEPLFGKRDTGVMETLSFLHDQHLLNARHISKGHFCSHCGSAFLNFKESCTQCDSDDISANELLHHFKCAYTAEISEFKQGDQLQCPKCERELRHIGVDYDKPSMIYHCNQCSHSFQDPKIMTECYNCGRSSEPEHQQLRVIQAYSVSAIGQNAAEYGLEALFTNLLEKKLNLFSVNAFRDFFNIEASRIKRYGVSASTLVMINFDDLDQLYIRLGSKAQEVFSELSVIFKTVLRKSDVITAWNESIFFVIMTETNEAQAHRAVERLRDGVMALFKNNLDFAPKFTVSINTIDETMDLDKTLEAFMENHVD